jgi:hypothetical protein
MRRNAENGLTTTVRKIASTDGSRRATSPFIVGLRECALLQWRRLDAATFWASGPATRGIAIVGLDRRHDRFRRPGAR